MVRVGKLTIEQSPLNEREEVKKIIASQLAQHLQGGYIEELLRTLKVGNKKPESIKEVVVGSSLIGSSLIGSGKQMCRCNACKGKGKKYNKMCDTCHGSGFTEILQKGLNFLSNLFGRKKNDDYEPQEPETNFDYDYDTKPQQSYNKPQNQSYNKQQAPKETYNPDFLVHGNQRTELLKKLGLSSNSTKAEVRTAYLKLSKKYHPDKGGDPEDFKKLLDVKTQLIGGDLKKQTVGTKEDVWNSSSSRTSGGLKKTDLMKNARGKIISKRQFEAGQRAYENLKAFRK